MSEKQKNAAEGRAASSPATGVRMGSGSPRGREMVPIEKPKNFKGTLLRLFDFMSPHHFKLALVLIFTIAGSLLNGVGPKIISIATNEITRGSEGKLFGIPPDINLELIFKVLLCAVCTYFLGATFRYLEQYIMTNVTQEAMYELRQKVDKKLSTLPLKYYDTNAFGDILSRVTNDVDTVANSLQQSIIQLGNSLFTFLTTMVMMFVISPTLAIIAIVMVPPIGIISGKIIKSSQKYFIGQQNTLGKLNGYIEEALSGHNIVKAFGNEKMVVEDFKAINEELYGYSKTSQFISSIIMPISTIVSNITYILVVFVWSLMAFAGKLTVGDLQAFLTYLRQFANPINQIANISNIIQSTVAASERIFELLDEEEETPDPQKPLLLPENSTGNVEFKNVRFGYNAERVIINDFSLKVDSGHRIALVGPTGAGKTTIVNLIMRFYDINSGQILVDGTDIYSLTRHGLRENIGMVLQDTWLFKGSVMENIRYGRLGATDEEVMEAAKAARSHMFITQLPGGYNFMLTEDAANISQGQRQLLTIARAILKNPKILILDEATSSVDTRTELAIQQGMNTLMQNRTSFVIAHRLSTIRDADIILFINNGDIVEAGSHNQLIEKGGYYATLYNSQFRGESENAEDE